MNECGRKCFSDAILPSGSMAVSVDISRLAINATSTHTTASSFHRSPSHHPCSSKIVVLASCSWSTTLPHSASAVPASTCFSPVHPLFAGCFFNGARLVLQSIEISSCSSVLQFQLFPQLSTGISTRPATCPWQVREPSICSSCP